MRVTCRTISRVIAAMAVLATTTVDAFGYLDPGTGSILIQALIAAFAAAALTVRYYWQRITDFLRHSFSRKREQDQDEPARDDES